MTLADVFNPNIIKVGLESDDKDELFEEMVQVIIDSYSSLSREKLLLALEQREALMSTGIIHDVAVPHGKTDAVNKIIGCIGVSKKGIDYQYLIYPNDFAETSLQIFKKLAIILDDASFRQEVLSQNSAHGIYDVLCRYENRLGD